MGGPGVNYTAKQVSEIVDSEGLGYAVTEYLNASSIQDPELRAAWAEAAAALAKVQQLLPEV